jgi:hypothetical protein
MTNLDELFEIITKIIAEPHNVITEHDKRRAIQVFLGFDDYLIDALPGYCEEGCEIDFGAYAAGVIDELEGTDGTHIPTTYSLDCCDNFDV